MLLYARLQNNKINLIDIIILLFGMSKSIRL